MAQAAATARGPTIRVMVVDDSAVVRGFLVRMLESDPRIEIVATCSNGQMAVQQASRRDLDVIVLDIEMPVMDGLTALPALLKACPRARIVMASTLTRRNAAISIEALSLGATDYVTKPAAGQLGAADSFRREFVEKVVALGSVNSARSAGARDVPLSPIGISSQRAVAAQPRRGAARPRIIAIGSSTGGPQALMSVLSALPQAVNCPIVIAQHMPATFTTILAQHLARASGRPCSEAVNGAEIRPGTIFLAPGDFHLDVHRSGETCTARISQTPPENFCRPSVDPLFRSVARAFGAESCGVVLTGMGSDGSAGARALAAAGAPIVAQDEATSVVWGMPGSVVQAGIGATVLPLPEIAGHLASLFQGRTP